MNDKAVKQELGQMESIAPECTPLKLEYDSCFNSWFKEYLDVNAMMQQAGATTSPNGWHAHGSLFSASNNQVHKLASLKARYDNECGKLFEEYQACVKVSRCKWLTMQRAVKDRGLEESIEKARQENPFPMERR